MSLLLIAACFLTHNDVYEQNINKKRLNICPMTYNRYITAPILPTTLTHHVIKLQELKTHISICHAHNKRHWLLMSSNSWSMNWISASSPEQQLSFRICQFAWLETLLQKQRWEKRWWCRHKFKRLYYIQNHK